METTIQETGQENKPHDCSQNRHVDKCDGDRDECSCRVCGKKWSEPCSFDDDYD